MSESNVLIIGAGLAGLACARRLAQCQIPFQLVEASDRVGGRVRTDLVDGFRLDRGFQIYLDAYPEGRRVLDLSALDLRSFTRGAKVRVDGRFYTLTHPRAGFWESIRGGFSPIGTFLDKLRILRLAFEVTRGKLDDQLEKPEQLTLDFLRWKGRFTPKMIERFFRPFLGGVFLEKNLTTSSRMFRFVMRMFTLGNATIPARGMQAIPDQLAAGLPIDSIRLQTRVDTIDAMGVRLSDGSHLLARAVIIAVEGPEATRLLNRPEWPSPRFVGTTTLYFAAPKSPEHRPILVLNGEGVGLINNLVVMSDASPDYAPDGQSLIAVSVIGVPELDDRSLETSIRQQLVDWYGDNVKSWRLLRIDRIPLALPDQSAGQLEPARRPVRIRPGLYVCGDHRDLASIDGALTSGFRVAQTLMEDINEKRI